MDSKFIYGRKQGRLGLLELNRPDALHALSKEMIVFMSETLEKWRKDPEIYGVILEACGERAFCAGADVKAISLEGQKNPEQARQFFQAEYGYNWQLHKFTKPHIALINGLVLGGGVGISLYGTHRVAGENYRFGMPETAIGLVPDVGASWFLGHLPGSVGLYLALTGRMIGRADAFALGLVTHCIEAEHFSQIKPDISLGGPVDSLLDELHTDPGKGELVQHQGWIEAIFSASSIEEILSRAQGLADESEGWSQKVYDELMQKSPTSLVLTQALWKRGRRSSLRKALEREYEVVSHLLEGGDFYEGVRAMLIDKDKTPHWNPQSVAELSNALYEELSGHVGQGLQLPDPVEA